MKVVEETTTIVVIYIPSSLRMSVNRACAIIKPPNAIGGTVRISSSPNLMN